ncbi:hypothetical protein HDZ31DRAFT_61741 [Schizophyllum fasciatum]
MARYLSSPRRLLLWPGRYYPGIAIALFLTITWYYLYFGEDIFYNPRLLGDFEFARPPVVDDIGIELEAPAYVHPPIHNDAPGPDPPSAVLAEAEAPVSDSPWCQFGECGVGKWVPRVPAVEKLVFGDPPSCRRPIDIYGNLIPEDVRPALEVQRSLDIVNWDWVPSRGKLMDLDMMDMAVRLMQSPGGLILIGDSLTVQHRDTFSVGFPSVGIHYDVNPPHLFEELGYTKIDNVVHWVARNNTPAWNTLMERAGVPASRMERPLLTVIQYHLSVNETEIREMTEGPEDAQWAHGSGRGAHPRVPGFQELVASLATPVPEHAETVTKDTVVLFNTGAHWSRGVMGNLIPRSNAKTEHALLHRTYQRMMDMHFRRLHASPRTSIFFRTTAPAHANCHETVNPYPSAQDADAADATLFTRLMEQAPDAAHALTWARWDWDKFRVHNGMWKAAIEKAQQARLGTGEGPRWFYLDIYGLSLQRGDAHSNPDNDCLHWCGRAVPVQWTRQLYHQLKLLDMQDVATGSG